MCDFFSAVYRADGAEYHNKTNSHSSMVQAAGWPENGTRTRQVYWEAEWYPPFEGQRPPLEARDGDEPTVAAIRAWDRRAEALRAWWQGERLNEIPKDWIDVAVVLAAKCRVIAPGFPGAAELVALLDRIAAIKWLSAESIDGVLIDRLVAARDAAGNAAGDAAWIAACIIAGLINDPPGKYFFARLACYEAGVLFDGDRIMGAGWRELGRLPIRK